MLRFLLLALLSLMAATGTATAQKIWSDTAAARVKGSIWTATANRVWADRQLTIPKPPAWPTDAVFQLWMDEPGKPDLSGLGELRQAVRTYKKNNSTLPNLPNGSLTPERLRDALVTAVHDLGKPKKHKLYPVKSKRLGLELDSILAQASLPPDKPLDSKPPDTPIKEPALPPDEPRNSHSTEKLVLWALLTGVLGAGLGFFFGNNRQTSPAKASHLPSGPSARPISIGNGTSVGKQPSEAKKLETELRNKQEEWDRERTNLLVEIAYLEQCLEQSKAAVSAPIEPSDSQPIAAPRPKFYASAAPGGVLEKVESEPSSRAVLLIEPDPTNPDRASFGLNPDVDQVWMTGIGFPAFRDYFEDASFVGAKNLSAARPGQLKRQGNGWQVDTKARLNVR